ncbi:MAG: HD domain-containing protein [Proteobacteria bacterium]|jgi:putative nucleotidyltransferase with HDIG domain|nr:HD domain-containing protein [Pseudomonadota bacterium]
MSDIPRWAYSSVASILEALKKTDPETYRHCLRVGQYSRLLAKSAGFDEYQQKISEFAGMLHDVGKMGVSQHIIQKPGKLTPEEYHQMMEHPLYSAELLKPLDQHEFFKTVLPAVKHHHERFDGEGYPDKLADESIPVHSRIILLVDTLDAMGQDRAYRKGLPTEVIYKEIRKFAGTQFDPQLAQIFLESHRFWGQQKIDPQTHEEIIKKAA